MYHEVFTGRANSFRSGVGVATHLFVFDRIQDSNVRIVHFQTNPSMR